MCTYKIMIPIYRFNKPKIIIYNKEFDNTCAHIDDKYIYDYLQYYNKYGYFVYSLIISILLNSSHQHTYISGEYIRNMFLEESVPNIIDIYCRPGEYELLSLHVRQVLLTLYSFIYRNGKELFIKNSICDINTLDSNYQSNRSTKITIRGCFGVLILNLHYINTYKLCKCITNVDNYTNYDYIQNSLTLSLEKKTDNNIIKTYNVNLKCGIVSMVVTVKAYLNRFRYAVLNKLMPNSIYVDDLILDKIIEYLCPNYLKTLEIIYSITKYELFPAHSLCCDLAIQNHEYYDGEKCTNCIKYINDMQRKYTKCKEYGFTVFTERCDKKLCLHDFKHLLLTDSERIVQDYKNIKTKKISFVQYMSLKCSNGSYNKNLQKNKTLLNYIDTDESLYNVYKPDVVLDD